MASTQLVQTQIREIFDISQCKSGRHHLQSLALKNCPRTAWHKQLQTNRAQFDPLAVSEELDDIAAIDGDSGFRNPSGSDPAHSLDVEPDVDVEAERQGTDGVDPRRAVKRRDPGSEVERGREWEWEWEYESEQKEGAAVPAGPAMGDRPRSADRGSNHGLHGFGVRPSFGRGAAWEPDLGDQRLSRSVDASRAPFEQDHDGDAAHHPRDGLHGYILTESHFGGEDGGRVRSVQLSLFCLLCRPDGAPHGDVLCHRPLHEVHPKYVGKG